MVRAVNLPLPGKSTFRSVFFLPILPMHHGMPGAGSRTRRACEAIAGDTTWEPRGLAIDAHGRSVAFVSGATPGILRG